MTEDNPDTAELVSPVQGFTWPNTTNLRFNSEVRRDLGWGPFQKLGIQIFGDLSIRLYKDESGPLRLSIFNGVTVPVDITPPRPTYRSFAPNYAILQGDPGAITIYLTEDL